VPQVGPIFAHGDLFNFLQILEIFCPGSGVAQWTPHPAQKQKTRVRIPPGYKVFSVVMAMILCSKIHCLSIERDK
jgi:hypothetical protein